eukprot:gene96-biopygen8990
MRIIFKLNPEPWIPRKPQDPWGPRARWRRASFRAPLRSAAAAAPTRRLRVDLPTLRPALLAVRDLALEQRRVRGELLHDLRRRSVRRLQLQRVLHEDGGERGEVRVVEVDDVGGDDPAAGGKAPPSTTHNGDVSFRRSPCGQMPPAF